MNNNNIIIITLIFFTIVLIYFICSKDLETMNGDIGEIYEAVSKDDTDYFTKFKTENQVFSNLINKNVLRVPVDKKNKILIVTFENRQDEYITMHNKNILAYTNKWNYEYKTYDTCDYNVYWCKIQYVLDALELGDYDYVMWMDSDTIIMRKDIDIGTILNGFSSDIFIAGDNITKYDLVNSGVFIIKNSDTGKEFLRDCIRNVKKVCFNTDGTLKGMWAASCYEQGQMNLTIADKYYNNTTVLPNEIILNYSVCMKDAFIMHLYGSSSEKRKNCFVLAETY